ncbi:MAG: ADOP family duplicated permease [Gemmatimonadales bacterium]
MPFIGQVRLWLRALLARTRVESDMEKEMRLHVEFETQHNIELGMPPDEARRAAMIAFGGVERTKESVRDERLTRWIEELAGDFTLALRGFKRQPAYTFGIIALIALGIGPNAAIFSVVNHLLLAPLPFQDGNRMVELTATQYDGQIYSRRTKADIDRWRARAHMVESITVTEQKRFVLGDTLRGATESVMGASVGPDGMAFVGMRPLHGRAIVPADTLPDATPVVLLSSDLWKHIFGGSVDAIGKTIILDQVSYIVIGVMPQRFTIPFAGKPQLYVALRGVTADRPVGAIAKLRHGATVADANRELAVIFPKLNLAQPEDAPTVERAVDQVAASTKRTTFLLFGAVGLVLLIACANVANLMVARAWIRQREFTIRAAMGARRGRLVRHVLVESLTLSLCGGVTGVAVAYGTLALLIKFTAFARELAGTRIEPVVLLWILAISIATGVLFGIAPALFVSSNRAADALKAGNRAVGGHRSSKRLRGGLVIGEVALSVVLLVASGLLARTISAMQHADLGFQSVGLYGVPVSFTDTSFADSVARGAAAQLVRDRVLAVPDVRAATYSFFMPPDYLLGVGQLEIDGARVVASDSLSVTNLMTAWPDIFAVLGVRILRGRAFANYVALTGRDNEDEIVVNAGFARRFFAGGNALGARIRRSGGQWSTIVGIANDIVVPGAPPRTNATQFYIASGAAPKSSMLLVRSDLPLARLAPEVREAIRAANPRVRVGTARAAEVRVATWRYLQAFTLRMIGAFAVLALVLAAFGLHATIAYSVGQRTRELGIRIALGAQSHNVMELVMGQGLKLTAAGLLIGAGGGVVAGRAMRALLYGVAPIDPVTLAVVGILLTAVALAASYAPANRATRVDPAETLRAE